jgi:membrane-associated HD superfamily phosphohydrolase
MYESSTILAPSMTTVANDDDTHDHQASPCLNLSGDYGQRPLNRIPTPIVMFNEDIEVREVATPSTDECQDRWYSTGEYFFIKKEAMRTVRRMASTRLEESDTTCTRGLEIVISEVVKQRKQTIESVVQAVLKEQMKLGSTRSDPEELARVYKQLNYPCIQRSIETAISDAKDVETYLADTRKTFRKKKKNGLSLRPMLRWFSRNPQAPVTSTTRS